MRFLRQRTKPAGRAEATRAIVEGSGTTPRVAVKVTLLDTERRLKLPKDESNPVPKEIAICPEPVIGPRAVVSLKPNPPGNPWITSG